MRTGCRLSLERRGLVVYFSGRTEFIERNTGTYSELAKKGWEVWTFDWRGQGFSERGLSGDLAVRGYIEGLWNI